MRRRGEGIFSYPPQPGDLEPFRLGSGDRGVLLIHGFCGTPPEMRGLGEHLAASGFRVHGALLKGHGTTPEDLASTRWTDWAESADAQLAELRKECAQVFVSGQSMGGALSLVLAARNPDVVAIATLSALVNLGRSTELQIDRHLLGILRMACDRPLRGAETHTLHLKQVLRRRLGEEDPVMPFCVGGECASYARAERCRTDLSIGDGLAGQVRDTSTENVSTGSHLCLKCCR